MKKRLLLFLMLSMAFLSACQGLHITGLPTAPPVQVGADADLATKVAKVLTATAAVAVNTATPNALAPKDPPAGDPPQQPTLAPTATLASSPTPTAAPTQEPSATPTPQPTQTLVPTQTVFIPTAAKNITPIATSTEDPRNSFGPATAADPMDSASLWNWPTGTDQFTSAQWANGAMRVTALSSTAGWRLPTAGPFGDIYIEMTARSETCSGKDNYGLYFHIADITASSGYWFVISCDGYYRLSKWDGTTQPKGTYDALINWTASKKIRQGAGQPNRLGVLLKGSKMSMYINGNYVASTTDATFANGYFGVFINSKATNNYTIDVDDMAYWTNPQ